MKLKCVVVDIEKTVGKAKFGGLREEHMGRVRNTRTVVSRDYNICSEVQKEEIQVRLPGRVGVKAVSFRQEVDFVNPRLIVEGRNIGGNGFSEYLIEADDIIPAGGAR